MLNFERYLILHGESGVQAIVDRIERYEGILSSAEAPLEDRWNALMQGASAQEQPAA